MAYLLEPFLAVSGSTVTAQVGAKVDAPRALANESGCSRSPDMPAGTIVQPGNRRTVFNWKYFRPGTGVYSAKRGTFFQTHARPANAVQSKRE